MARQNTASNARNEDEDLILPPADLAAPAAPPDAAKALETQEDEKQVDPVQPPAAPAQTGKIYAEVKKKFTLYSKKYEPGDTISDPALLAYCKRHRKPVQFLRGEP